MSSTSGITTASPLFFSFWACSWASAGAAIRMNIRTALIFFIITFLGFTFIF